MRLPEIKKEFVADRYGNKTISTTIPIELYKKIKINGMSFRELLIRGYQATEGFTKVLERLKELEDTNNRLVNKMADLGRKNIELNAKIEGIKYEVD